MLNTLNANAESTATQKHILNTENTNATEFYKKLRKFASAQYIEKVIHISLVNKYVYVHNAKVASSTIKKTLISHELNNSPIRDKNVTPHIRRESPLLWPAQLPIDMFYDVICSVGYFKFAFVRNPYTRLLSGYLDKFVGEHNVTPGRRAITKILDRKEDASVSFEEFVDVVVSRKPRSLNHHWRPQTQCLFFPIIKCNYIGKFEDFENSFNYVKDKIFKTDTLENKKTLLDIHHKTSSDKKLKEFYSKELINKVYKAYEEDFKNFGYVKELPV